MSQPDTRAMSFSKRANLPNTHPLAAFLLHLIVIKRTNLCLSADVTTTSALLNIAEEVGDSICMLKTHVDIISDFGEKTVRGLRDIARRKRFLVFEDRKFGDIGSTVQKQYTAGPFSIVRWAAITNAHIFPGPAIVTALKAAAADAIAAFNRSVETEISVGTPRPSSDEDDGSFDGSSEGVSNDGDTTKLPLRKRSIVAATTIESSTESTTLERGALDEATAQAENDREKALEALGSPPLARGLLLLAEMSSEGNLLTGAYTQKCIDIARDHNDFVIGFIAQHDLNSKPGDNFITCTPGISLPPPGQEGQKVSGDGLGQQYNTPHKAIVQEGCDVVIVGRGILSAKDRAAEAERYRREAWKAYEERVGAN
ncbi:Orotidine 5'-phosphate decarboxylase [Xylona heveae TC161]|uniref:Orotidine 5'-phosphate decarboxylase n=1 Tax=Xylona heveae (strain CBS 132557 / TC161) TaxID=1328760 RepID=A0A165JCY3_XYLHT|nr:Orotidine 5'-phosphate decarboxylase [Xylona heveae TC161]KZF26069.1 Orotidine 5'-phosphate decarboxylase [Xylona heveae TC161]